MFSGTPPVPRGGARGRGRGPPLLPISSDASDIGEAVLRLPTPPNTTAPSLALQIPDDAHPDGCSPLPTVPPQSARQYISLDDARSHRRFHERVNVVVTGTLSPPIPISKGRCY
ncbi:UNVERIFIED_CONTAM: hypothetical protein Sindi_1813700 [Sesamum indicum]